MNVGIVVDNDFVNDTRVVNEANILKNAGHNIFVLCIDFGSPNISDSNNGILVSRFFLPRKAKNMLFFIGNLFPLYYWIWAYRMRKFIKKYRIDILHLHDLYMLRAGIMVKRDFDIPLIIDLHENYLEAIKNYRWANKFPKSFIAQPNKWQFYERKILQKANAIIVLSEAYKRDLLNRYKNINEQDIIIYPNVPDIDLMLSYPINRNVLQRSHDETILFYFGGISQRRGIYTTIAALKLLIKRNFKVRLLLIGPVDKAEKIRFFQSIADPTISNMIIYIPWIDLSQLPSYIEQSDICLSPIVRNAQHEAGVANKVFQYMLFSRPVIVSDNKPQSDIVVQENCGLIFQSCNSNDLAYKIETLIKHPQDQKVMGENGKQAILEKYNCKDMSKALLNIYVKMQK